MPFSYRGVGVAPAAAAPSGDKSIGFNFRPSALTYPPGDNWVGPSVDNFFPTDYLNADGDTIQAGYLVTPNNAQLYTNTTSVNRLGGAQNFQLFFVALPAGSEWRVSSGQFIYVTHGQDIQLYDGSQGNQTLIHQSIVASQPANTVIDINGNVTDDLAWEANYGQPATTFVTPPIVDRGADTGLSLNRAVIANYLSHLRFEQI